MLKEGVGRQWRPVGDRGPQVWSSGTNKAPKEPRNIFSQVRTVSQKPAHLTLTLKGFLIDFFC